MNTFKLYTDPQSPNGTHGVLVTCSDDQVVGFVPEAVFGNIPSNHFGWGGDSLGNIDICYYGESVGMLSEDDDSYDRIRDGEYSDLGQVVEVSYSDVLEYLAVSPTQSALDVIKQIHSLIRKTR